MLHGYTMGITINNGAYIMEKILFTATVDSHILSFHIPYLKYFKEKGFEIHVASNGNCDMPYVDVKHNIPFERSPYKIANLKAYIQLKEIINKEKYALIHCHTPVASVLTRLAARQSRKRGTNVLYSAHGFHFYKGAPILNWLIYYPVEKWMSNYTDCLITTNNEDYQRISNNFKAKSIKLVHGVGVDLNKFKPQTLEIKSGLRKEYGYNESDFILMFAGELSYRKHQDLLINVVSLLKRKVPNVKILLAGVGDLSDKYHNQVHRLGVEENVHFLGYRKDLDNILLLSDIAVSSSRQEGLPVNVMMAMATGLPLVVTECRGNCDLVINGENGYTVGVNDIEGFASAVEKLYSSRELKQKFCNKNLEIIEKYSLEIVMKEMEKIYGEYMDY